MSSAVGVPLRERKLSRNNQGRESCEVIFSVAARSDKNNMVSDVVLRILKPLALGPPQPLISSPATWPKQDCSTAHHDLHLFDCPLQQQKFHPFKQSLALTSTPHSIQHHTTITSKFFSQFHSQISGLETHRSPVIRLQVSRQSKARHYTQHGWLTMKKAVPCRC